MSNININNNDIIGVFDVTNNICLDAYVWNSNDEIKTLVVLKILMEEMVLAVVIYISKFGVILQTLLNFICIEFQKLDGGNEHYLIQEK